MPTYDFRCKKCNAEYSELTPHDDTGKYPKVKCPECNSKSKIYLLSAPAHKFSNPIGTDVWNSDSGGHGYRYEWNKPRVKAQRAIAEATSHMGSDPYGDTSAADIELDTGIHDSEGPIRLLDN